MKNLLTIASTYLVALACGGSKDLKLPYGSPALMPGKRAMSSSYPP